MQQSPVLEQSESSPAALDPIGLYPNDDIYVGPVPSEPTETLLEPVPRIPSAHSFDQGTVRMFPFPTDAAAVPPADVAPGGRASTAPAVPVQSAFEMNALVPMNAPAAAHASPRDQGTLSTQGTLGTQQKKQKKSGKKVKKGKKMAGKLKKNKQDQNRPKGRARRQVIVSPDEMHMEPMDAGIDENKEENRPFIDSVMVSPEFAATVYFQGHVSQTRSDSITRSHSVSDLKILELNWANSNGDRQSIASGATVHSKLDEVPPYKIKKALVAMIGIGEYPQGGGALSSLEGVPQDYINMINIFVKRMNWRFVYETTDSKLVYLNQKELKRYYKKNFKVKWTSKEIDTFVDNCKKIINEKKNDIDSLLFILSSHGDSDNVLLDSNFDEHQLQAIVSKFWNTVHDGCPQLADKPKIFIFDMCRGMQTPVAESLISGKKKKLNIPTKGRKGNGSDTVVTDDSHNSHNSNESSDEKSDVHANKQNIKALGAKDNVVVANKNKNENENESMEEKANSEHLKTENFCYIYSTLEGYAAVDGKKKGGYLIRSIYKVLMQLMDESKMDSIDLKGIIDLVRQETRRLAQNKDKEWKSVRRPNSNPAIQVVESTENLQWRVYFRVKRRQFSA